MPIARGGTATQDPLYPEGHPKRIEQESQLAENIITSSPKRKKKKKKHKELGETSNMEIDKEPEVNNPNAVSISDAETESGNEHDNDVNEPPVSKKHGKERESHGCKNPCFLATGGAVSSSCSSDLLISASCSLPLSVSASEIETSLGLLTTGSY